MLTIDHVTLCQNNKTLLSDIHLNIETGKLYGLIGHNGSGKSSLIKLLAGEYHASQGNVLFQHEPIHKIPSKRLAQHIAYLPQNLPDAQTFTVEELVMLGRYPWQRWLQKPSEEDKQVVQTAMSQAQILTKSTQTVSTLSGGERARAWLAMCLAQQTDYLLLDEPLAALDIVYQVEILKLVKQLVQERNLGVVIILHDINLAAQFCDEFIALKQGKLCYQGNVTETMNQTVLYNIFGINLHLLSHPVDGHKVAVV
ncbi:ABC transporter ATP-binding protein [Psychrobacter sp. I-STPA6b]|uniref:ABC transporter ATP-binding protein n=1 Tax=Psychrobacter sp. I-STPA6b TaxID=2585718 RepID=UPI001D0C5C73|nr:ABC transporter ATP-binding protein [Psychrobacter sp. I-STPA6b]